MSTFGFLVSAFVFTMHVALHTQEAFYTSKLILPIFGVPIFGLDYWRLLFKCCCAKLPYCYAILCSILNNMVFLFGEILQIMESRMLTVVCMTFCMIKTCRNNIARVILPEKEEIE